LLAPVVANLAVSITGTDADFVVKIIDVFPDDLVILTPQRNKVVPVEVVIQWMVIKCWCEVRS
jgi:hypothetical protein